MNDYIYGAGIALEQIARRFVKEPDRQKKDRFPVRSVNLLGVTPLDFGPQENVETLKENLKEYGWNVLSTWAMGDDLETLQKAGEATVSLVVSAVGLLAAEVLRETYKIPYVIGTPNQWLAEDISNALETTIMRHAAAIQQSATTQQSATAQQATVIEQSVVVQQSDSAAFYLKNRMQQSAEITLVH